MRSTVEMINLFRCGLHVTEGHNPVTVQRRKGARMQAEALVAEWVY